MWLIESVVHGFQPAYPSARYDLFRALVVLAIAWKFLIEHWSGAWGYFRPDSHVRFRYLAVVKPPAYLTERRYRIAYVIKIAACAALAVGVFPRVAAALLAAWFFFETRFDLKFHTVYIGLCAGCLALAPIPSLPAGFVFIRSLGTGTASDIASGGQASSVAAFVIVLITIQMYWSSAFYKIRSAQFRSGLGLEQFTLLMANSGPKMKLPEIWYRQPLLWWHAKTSTAQRMRLWGVAAWLTIGLEIVLPFGLLAERTWAAAAVIGIGLHAAFAALLPLRLIPFSLATCASYVLMRPF